MNNLFKDAIKPMIEEIGFVDVVIDDSNSLMCFEDDSEETTDNNENNANEDSRKKSAVHVGSAEFKHLSSLDMNDICARVVVYGRKPQ